MRNLGRISLLALLAGALTVAGTEAQEPQDGRPTLTAIELGPGERITLDGHLHESIWDEAKPATNFIQQDPNFGQPATERTEVRIVFDRERLYMGVICFDSEPDKLLGYQRRRDAFVF